MSKYRFIYSVVLIIILFSFSTFSKDFTQTDDINDAVIHLRPNQKIKLITESYDTLSGQFINIKDNSLFLFDNSENKIISISEISYMWLQQKYMDNKPKTYAGLGGVVGLGISAIIRETTRTTGSQPGGGIYPIMTIMFAGAGYILGTAYQSENREWILIFAHPEKVKGDTDIYQSAKKRKKKSTTFGAFFGLNHMSHPIYKGKFGLHISYLVNLNEKIAIGPEIGFSEGEKKPDKEFQYYYDKRFYHIKAIAKMSLDKHPIPYFLIGIGSNLNQNETGTFYNIGAGVDYILFSKLVISAEARWHDTFTSLGKPDIFNFKIGIGIR